RVRACAGAAPNVVLIPGSQCEASELAKVMLGHPLPSRDRVIRDAIAICGLKSVVSPLYSAPDGTRLVVDTLRGQVWLDGIAITGLRPDTHPFRFIELMARRSPSAVSTNDICTVLSAARKDDTLVARQAKNDANKV